MDGWNPQRYKVLKAKNWKELMRKRKQWNKLVEKAKTHPGLHCCRRRRRMRLSTVWVTEESYFDLR
jgi:hypothetical protein